MVERFAPNSKSVFFATAHLAAAFPAVVEHDLVWASRSPAQWLIPGIAIARHNARINNIRSRRDLDIENFARTLAVNDFLHYEPDLVLFDVREKKTYFGMSRFDYLDFYMEDKQFEEFWTKNYGKVLTTNHIDIYRKYNPKR
jgi:hypothetical protein